MNSRSLILIMLLFVSLFFTSCNKNKRFSTISFDEIYEKEVALNYTSIRPINNYLSINDKDSNVYLYFQDFKSHEIFSVLINHGEINPVLNTKLKFDNPYYEIYLLNSDSVFSFSNGTNELTLRNKNYEIVKSFHVNNTVYPVITPECVLSSNGDRFLFANASVKLGFGQTVERKMYYEQTKPLIILNILDTLRHGIPFGKFPEKYYANGDNFYNPFPTFCFGKENKIFVSFNADDFVYLYHDTSLVIRKEIKSENEDKFTPYPDEKQFDMLFLKEYISKEPKYLKVVFDPWQNLYYRLVKHRYDATNKQQDENTWSVIVFDEELNVLGEKKFSYSYNPEIFIPTPIGVFLAKSTPTNGNTIFSIIKITRNG